jgi:hypothetical protein
MEYPRMSEDWNDFQIVGGIFELFETPLTPLGGPNLYFSEDSPFFVLKPTLMLDNSGNLYNDF